MAVSIHTTHGPNWVSTLGLLQRASNVHMGYIFGFSTLVSFLLKPYKESVNDISFRKLLNFKKVLKVSEVPATFRNLLKFQ